MKIFNNQKNFKNVTIKIYALLIILLLTSLTKSAIRSRQKKLGNFKICTSIADYYITTRKVPQS